MQTTIRILPRSKGLRFCVFFGSGTLLALGLSVFSHYRYWHGTIKSVQTTQLNILTNNLPTKLSLLLIEDDKEEIQRLLDSSYGFIGLIVTDCKQRQGNCYQENIIYRTSIERGWTEQENNLSQQPFDLLLNPPPTKAEYYYPHSYAHDVQVTANNNQGEIMGRVYYLRSTPPTVINGLKSWLVNLLQFRTIGLLHPYTAFWLLVFISSCIGWQLIEREITRIEEIAKFKQKKLEGEINSIKIENQQLIKDKQQLQLELNQLLLKTTELNAQTIDLQTKVKDRENQLVATQFNIDNTKLLLTKYQEQLQELKQQNLVKNSEQEELERKIQESQKLLSEQEKSLLYLQDNLTITKASLLELETEKQEINELLKAKEKENNDLEIILKNLVNNLAEKEAKIKQLEQYQQDSNEWEEIINSYDQDLKQLDKLKQDNQLLQREINRLEDSKRQLEISLIATQKPEEIEPNIDVQWTIICTNKFFDYWSSLKEEQQIKIATYINYLERVGLNLGYPRSTKVKNSSFRELRAINTGNEAIRIFYRFTPQQVAILLSGADKDGVKDKDKWYREQTKIAEREYNEYCENNDAIPFAELWTEMSEYAREQVKQLSMKEP